VLSGRSDALAWGLTTAGLDDLDVYLERLDPEDPDRYLTPAGDHVPFRTESSVIRVKGGDPVTIDFCHRMNLSYVSCSPFRVPIARLAAAQAAMRDDN